MSAPHARPRVAACAACCAGPLPALLGGVGAASALASFWVPALAVVAVPAVGTERRS
ncbi:hypothetical protein [Streptomyces niveus]|uniref:hypothetical protein n=1 Tax=Streptomyces niveus TaxID=193462 RepID=UPI00363FD31C